MKTSTNHDSINIILSYNDKDLTVIVKRFNKLYYIKNKAYQLFYPIKSDIKLKYNNKDLSSLLDQSIGLIFENRGRVKLTIEEKLGTKRPLLRKTKINSQNDIFNCNNYNSEIKVQEPQLTNDRYKSIQTESPPKINNKSISLKTNKTKKKLPPLKIKTSFNMDISTYTLCRECLKTETKFYCRKCNKFICSICKNKKHNNHLLLNNIDIMNEKINIDKYKEEIINILYFAINNFDNLDNIKTKEINIEEWKNKYNEGVIKLVNLSRSQKEEMKLNKSNLKNKNNKNELQKIIKEEKQLLDQINISADKDPFQLFNDINKRERLINYKIKKVKNQNNKIEDMFIDIENEIDYILFELEEQINYK